MDLSLADLSLADLSLADLSPVDLSPTEPYCSRMSRTEEPADNASRAPNGARNWFTSNLVTLGSAAVLTVYAAGYMKTRAAAQRFAQEDLARQRPAPSMVASLAAEPPRQANVASGTTAAAEQDSRKTSADSGAPESRKLRAVNELVSSAAPAARVDSTPAAAPAKNAIAAVAPTPPKTTDSSATVKTQSTDTTAQPEKPKSQWKDGIYKGYGTSRHGDIEAEVEIKGGRIVFANISNCLTQYPCSVFDMVVPQVIIRQGPEVDFVSGATQSVNAFYYAVVQALSKAK